MKHEIVWLNSGEEFEVILIEGDVAFGRKVMSRDGDDKRLGKHEVVKLTEVFKSKEDLDASGELIGAVDAVVSTVQWIEQQKQELAEAKARAVQKIEQIYDGFIEDAQNASFRFHLAKDKAERAIYEKMREAIKDDKQDTVVETEGDGQ